MLKKALIVACLMVCFVGLSVAEDVTVELEGRYWVTELEGSSKVVEAGVGESFNLDTDLNLDDENLPEGRIIWNITPNNSIRCSYTQVEYSGNENITQSITFKGKTYTAGTRVDSTFDIRYATLGWIWQFINLVDDKVKFGSIIDAKAISADIALEAPSLSFNESESFLGVLPTVGCVLNVRPIEQLDIFGEISGLVVDDYGYFFDAEAGIKFIPYKHVSILGGYRIIDMEVEDSSNFVSIQIAGPFAGARIRF